MIEAIVLCFVTSALWIGILIYKLSTDKLTLGTRHRRWELERSFDYDTARIVLIGFHLFMATIFAGVGVFLLIY